MDNDLLKVAARHGRLELELHEGKPTSLETDPVRWVEQVGLRIETKTHGLIPFTPYPFQKQIMRAVATGEAYVIDKARQIGVSTAITAGAFSHQLLYRQLATGIPFHCHIIANKEEVSVQLLLRKVKTALSTADLPTWQRERLQGIDPKVNNSEIRYYTAEGQNYIRAHSSGPNVGRSFDGNAALLEEFAFMPYGQDVWTAIAPMLDDLEKAPVFIVSTYNGDGDLFCQFVDHAKEFGLHHLPIDWRAHPNRDEKWRKRSLRKFTGCEDLWKQEYELHRIKSGSRLVDIRRVEDWAHKYTYLTSIPQSGHRYSKGVDLAGPGRSSTVHVVTDLSVKPPQVVHMEVYAEQSTEAKIHTIEETDTLYPGPLFIDGTHDPAVAAQVKARTKVAVRFTAGRTATESIDRVEGLRWRNIPRTMMLSWLGANLDSGALVVHVDEFPELFTALKTANRGEGQKAMGENVDHLDALLLSNLPLTRSRKHDTNENNVVGVEADPRIGDIRGVRW